MLSLYFHLLPEVVVCKDRDRRVPTLLASVYLRHQWQAVVETVNLVLAEAAIWSQDRLDHLVRLRAMVPAVLVA